MAYMLVGHSIKVILWFLFVRRVTVPRMVEIFCFVKCLTIDWIRVVFPLSEDP